MKLKIIIGLILAWCIGTAVGEVFVYHSNARYQAMRDQNSADNKAAHERIHQEARQ